MAYVDALARSGYIVLKPDYRGHGNSEGEPVSNYYAPAYVIDVLNAVASMRQYTQADPTRIGMWGHSMGGNIALKSLVVSNEIKVAVIWAGVVGSYADLLERWRPGWGRGSPEREGLLSRYGTPATNPAFWNAIEPYQFLDDIAAPIQLHHAVGDTHVPNAFSEHLAEELRQRGKTVEYYVYDSSDHNLADAFSTAMSRTIAFFDRYLK